MRNCSSSSQLFSPDEAPSIFFVYYVQTSVSELNFMEGRQHNKYKLTKLFVRLYLIVYSILL